MFSPLLYSDIKMYQIHQIKKNKAKRKISLISCLVQLKFPLSEASGQQFSRAQNKQLA